MVKEDDAVMRKKRHADGYMMDGSGSGMYDMEDKSVKKRFLQSCMNMCVEEAEVSMICGAFKRTHDNMSMEKPEGEMEEYGPPGHHLDRQYCNSLAQFQAGECRGCEKLCLSGERYAEEEGKTLSCSCCDQYDCTDGSTTPSGPETEAPEGEEEWEKPEGEMSGSGMGKPEGEMEFMCPSCVQECKMRKEAMMDGKPEGEMMSGDGEEMKSRKRRSCNGGPPEQYQWYIDMYGNGEDEEDDKPEGEDDKPEGEDDKPEGEYEKPEGEGEGVSGMKGKWSKFSMGKCVKRCMIGEISEKMCSKKAGYGSGMGSGMMMDDKEDDEVQSRKKRSCNGGPPEQCQWYIDMYGNGDDDEESTEKPESEKPEGEGEGEGEGEKDDYGY